MKPLLLKSSHFSIKITGLFSDLFTFEEYVHIIPITVYNGFEAMFINNISTKEASENWEISDRRIRVLCQNGRISGAVKFGRNWSIPSDAVKPIDARESVRKEYLGLHYDFEYIDSLKYAIDIHRPFSKNLEKTLHENLVVEWTYNSNTIEENTLTMSETKVVLEGITIGGKSVIEHSETINHREAILFIEDLILNKELFSEWNIKNIHSLIQIVARTIIKYFSLAFFFLYLYIFFNEEKITWHDKISCTEAVLMQN